MTEVAAVEVRAVGHSFDKGKVLCDVNLSVLPGLFVTLLGPSGSGKTTLLRIIGGLLYPDSGQLLINGRDVTGVPARARGIGFVFQNYALFPHMTVRQNVAFPLRARRVDAPSQTARVDEVMALVELSEFADRYPAQLSGGQQQRVAFARALVFEPSVVLMDEPLGSLDKRLREHLQDSIKLLQRRIGFTTIYVTHDQSEAFALSDRICVMNDGLIVQSGSPEAIYRQPEGSFVADFVGDINRFEGAVAATEAGLEIRCAKGLKFTLPHSDPAPMPGDRLLVGVRPERILLEASSAGFATMPGRIHLCSFQGSRFRLVVLLDNGTLLEVEKPATSEALSEGLRVWVGWDPEAALILEMGVS